MVYVWNKLLIVYFLNIMSFEAFYKRKPSISYLRVWRCIAYIYIQWDKQNSLQSHAEKYVFISYSTRYKIGCFINPLLTKSKYSNK